MPEVSFECDVRKQGGSLVISIPKPLLDAFEIKDGDTLVLTASDDGISMRKADEEDRD